MGFRLAGRLTTGIYVVLLGQDRSIYAYEALLYCYEYHRDDIAGTGLAQDVLAVGAHGIGAELDALGYLVAAQPLAYQGEDLTLAEGQVCQVFAVHHFD